MNPMLMAAAAVCLAALTAWLVAAPPSRASRRRTQDHRRRYVARHPAAANLGDVERRLAEEVPRHHVDFVLVLVERHRIDSGTLWAWLDRFGADALVLALASGHGYAALLRLLRADTAPDTGELGVLARLSTPELFADAAAPYVLAAAFR